MDLKEDGLWEVVEKTNAWELALRRRKILNLNLSSVVTIGQDSNGKSVIKPSQFYIVIKRWKKGLVKVEIIRDFADNES